jgi:hypothetical protein
VRVASDGEGKHENRKGMMEEDYFGIRDSEFVSGR